MMHGTGGKARAWFYSFCLAMVVFLCGCSGVIDPLRLGFRWLLVKSAEVASDLLHRDQSGGVFRRASQESGSCRLFSQMGREVPSAGQVVSAFSVGYARETFAVPASVRLGGYGLFPLTALFSSAGSIAFEPVLVGVESLVVRRGPLTWVLISVPAIGFSFAATHGIEQAALRALVARESGLDTDALGGCTMVTVTATHTHSAPDSIGLWGGVSSHLFWSLAQEDHQMNYWGPLLKSVHDSVTQALASREPAKLTLNQGRLPTTATKRRAAKQQSEFSSPLNSHVLKFGYTAYFWVADAHAATNLGKRHWREAFLPGDFPQYVRDAIEQSIGKPFHFIYAPGLIGRSYPDERDDWPEAWVRSVRDAVASGQSSGLNPPASVHANSEKEVQVALESDVLSFAQIDLCAQPTLRIFAPLESWARLWSGEESEDPCDVAYNGWRTVRLQKVQMGAVVLIFTPFELFPHAASSILSTFGGLASQNSPAPSPLPQGIPLTQTKPIFVSLANGFLGYAGIPGRDDMESYHKALSVFDPLPLHPDSLR